MRSTLLVPLLLVVLVSAASASPWSDRGLRLDLQAAEGRPTRFRAFDLSGGDLVSALLRAPRENSPFEGVEISLPMPDGSLQRFRAREADVLSPELRLRHPEIHAYVAVGIDHPANTAHIDLTTLGVRAVIHTPEATAYVDPLVRGRTDAVLAYWARDVREDGTFECRVEDRSVSVAAAPRPRGSQGGQVKNLRLVLLGTGEYTQYLGGISSALAEMVTSVNRVNAIYERDAGIHFVIVGLTPFPDPATDPYVVPSDLDGNQVVADSLYGPDGYDVAQLEYQQGSPGSFSGVSFLPAVCMPWRAGSTVTLGDVHANDLMIKVMAHELGHTLGARHTGDGPCQFDPSSSVEPGSGTSIMARAGKCGPYDVVPPPGDLYFIANNIEQMTDTLASYPTCGSFVANGNAAPTAEAGFDYTIPRQTPFILSGSGIDPDPSDVLTYTWDEQDVAVASLDTVTGPIFRFRPPSAGPARYFPDYGTVLADTVNRWERLPVVDRLIHFRLVVRDNHPGGGGQAWDDKVITVNGPPFSLTYPHGGEAVVSGPFTVTWDVGGGSVAPTVNIDLSIDGGASWTSLAANVPNDGSQDVSYFSGTALPNCRVRVSAVGNIFYTISRSNFAIQGGATDAGAVPVAFGLRLLGSNPSRAGARFEIRLARESNVDLAIYTVSGKRIRTLASDRWPAGAHPIAWDGKAGNRDVSAGVYIARLVSGDLRADLRFILVR